MFFVLALLLLIFLPSPWNVVGAVAGLCLFALEVLYWQRRMRAHKVQTGVENLVGATGEVATRLSPRGQIRVQGELWDARSASELGVGTPVRVVAVHGLMLEVEPANGGSRPGAGRLGSITAAVIAAVALAGCGGDGGPSASEEYANSVCSDLSSWVTSLQSTAQSLADAGLSIDMDAIRTAVSEASDATDTLVNDLKELDPPESEDGQKAKSELDSLGTELKEQVDTVEQALDSNADALSLASTVATAVSTATADVKSTFEELRNLDPAGELKEAFENSDDCKSLRDQVENIGS